MITTLWVTGSAIIACACFAILVLLMVYLDPRHDITFHRGPIVSIAVIALGIGIILVGLSGVVMWRVKQSQDNKVLQLP